MKEKMVRVLGMVLVFGLLLTNILYENTPVQAAGDSSATADSSKAIYKWYQAKNVNDLKKYYDKSLEKTWNYQGTWMPIIIVAEYPDGTCYYMNRDTELSRYHSDEESLIPHLKEVSSNDSVGFILKNAMREDGEFYTKGDLHAMHMFYHGKQTSYYEDGSITADAWSLTADPVSDVTFGNQSVDAPSTVYGIRNHNTYVTIDQNKVLDWNNTKTRQALPRTRSPRDTTVEFRQAWSFIPYQNDTFLISNMFSWGTKFRLDDGSDAYALTMGCVISGISRLSNADENHRNILETPSRAAAEIYDSGKSTNTLEGEEARRAIIKQYEHKYNKTKTRVHFKIFVGQKEAGSQTMDSETVTGNKIIGRGNTLPAGKTITVEKGAVLVVPDNSFFYFSGEIINYGTVIIGENSVVTADGTLRDGPWDSGYIQCLSGGTLVVMKNARVALKGGLALWYASMVNKGSVLVDKEFAQENSQIQMEEGAQMAVGVSLWNPQMFKNETISSFDRLLRERHSGEERPGYYVDNIDTHIYLGGENSIVLRQNSAVYISWENFHRKINIPTFLRESPKQWGMENLSGMDFKGTKKEIVYGEFSTQDGGALWIKYSAGK